ncbi:MAG TPA: hypothetical protein VMA09_02755 [Candidatus Binataceae bacterium]|nr:hypothetical protein [Candidatus Binataceae bacterium]
MIARQRSHPVSAWVQAVLATIGAELRRLNNARASENELQSLSRKEQAMRVKAHLREHHHKQSRCC